MMRAEFSAERLLPHALCALRDNLQVQAGEDLGIAYDETVSRSFYEALRIAAKVLGARVVTVTYEPVAYRPIKEYGLFAGRSLQEALYMPPVVRDALRAGSAFILLCSDTELLFSPDLKAI